MFSHKMKIRINLVFFMLLAIGLVYAMATQVLSVLQDRYSVYAIFPDAGGVFTNQEVTYRGLNVGQVGKLDIVDEGVSIELLIKEGVDIPSEGIEARVMFKSAVGEQFVDLLPTTDDEPFLQDGEEIPLSQNSIPVSTQELLVTLDAVLKGVPPESLKGAVDALGIGLTGRGQDLATIIESAAELAALFAERGPEIEGILREGSRFGEAALQTKEEFAAAIHDLVAVSQSLSNSRSDLQRLLAGTSDASDELVSLIRENRPELNEVLIELAEVNDIQAKHTDDIARLLQHLPTALGNINKAFEPDTGLIRFGLIQESEAPACSYATNRRGPEQREERKPPKNVHCGEGNSGAAASLTGTTSEPSALASLFGGTSAQTGSGAALPAQLSDWSWSLFYLNGF